MAFIDLNFKEIFSAQLVSVFGGLIAGVLLAAFTDKILLIPAMFIFILGFFQMRENIGGSFSSRISSGLFLDVIKLNKMNSKIIRGNLIASFLLAIIISLVLGLIAFLFTLFAFQVFFPKIILLALVAGLIANAIEIPLTLYFTFYFFGKGHDPNNIMAPFISSTGDIVSTIALLIAVVII